MDEEKRRECLITSYPVLHGDSGYNAPGPVVVHGRLVRSFFSKTGLERKENTAYSHAIPERTLHLLVTRRCKSRRLSSGVGGAGSRFLVALESGPWSWLWLLQGVRTESETQYSVLCTQHRGGL